MTGMSSRSARTDMNGDEATARPRVGLSEYTTNRLAELRARRAELDADYSDYKAKTRTDGSPTTSPTSATSSSSMSTSDLLESYRARRGLPSNGTGSPTAVRKTDYSTANGTATNGVTSAPSTTRTSPTKLASSPLKDSPPALQSEKKVTSANGSSAASRLAKTSTGGLGMGASFSKADYSSSRGNQLDQVKTSSVGINRSNSARVGAFTEDDEECVGFASLPEQVHRKAVKRGFDFTLMVVGETGLGKSTLISSLFLNPDLYKDREILPVQESLGRTVEIENKYMEIEEKGVKLRLTIVDTPGFNDSLDAEQSWRPIEQYISQQFDQYFKDESGLNRKHIKDHRVHCCLYFLSPYGHGLRQIDVQFMKRLHDKVNIVPIIAKADTLTPAEVRRLKEKVLDQVDEHGIHIYEFPDCDSDEDEDFKKQDSQLKAAIPFAVIGSNTVVEVGGAKVRGRLYPWGVVEVDNPQHCDFCKLRMMLISTHMQDLKDVTRDVHYENFRAQHIKAQLTRNQRERNSAPDDCKLKPDSKSKLKRDSSPNFESIMDNSLLLEQKDAEIRRMQEMILQMQAEINHSKTNGSVTAAK